MFLRNPGERLSNYTVQHPENSIFILQFLIRKFITSSDDAASMNKINIVVKDLKLISYH